MPLYEGRYIAITSIGGRSCNIEFVIGPVQERGNSQPGAFLKFRYFFWNLDNSYIFAHRTSMRVIAKKTLVAFYTRHADAETALEEWYEKTEEAEWNNFSDLKRTFHSADYIGEKRVVFNIKGNDYRLVGIVLFRIKMVYFHFIGTHPEYDRMTEEQLKTL